MIAVVLATPLTVLSSENTVPSQSTTYTVTYHQGSYGVDPSYNETGSNGKVTVTYHGVPVSEYNPQFWSGNITGDVDSNPSDWYKILRYGEYNWIGRFEGNPKNVTVFTGWASNSNQSDVGPIDPGTDLRYLDTDKDYHIDLYATWSRANAIESIRNINDLEDCKFNSGNKYTNLAILNGSENVSMSNLRTSPLEYEYGKGINGFTIRSNVGETHYVDVSKKYHYGDFPVGYAVLNTEVIIDNVGLWTDVISTRDDFYGYGLFAQSNKLIIGTGVTCTSSVLIYGGYKEGGSGVGNVVVFSGTYYSIFGGSQSGDLSSSSVTVMGGEVENTIYGGSNTGSVGATEVLMAGGLMNKHGSGDPVGVNHSTIVGGSWLAGTVQESVVTISNKAIAFAVQGGGRTSNTSTVSTHVTVSGKAVVSFMVCGSVTDGNTNERSVPVETSNVHITDAATIGEPGVSEYGCGCVFGGGWDTYQEALYPSTEHTNVTISGGTIYGSVYGGGYRGSIGDGAKPDHQAVKINVTSGTIHGSVYGGGRGGEDPITNQDSDDKGLSHVYGNINVRITGGSMTNVYGGGEGISGSAEEDECAKVKGNTSIYIEGATIKGSVYGGGRGVSGNTGIGAVVGSTNVIVECEVKGSVYGGGENGVVKGNTEVTISSTGKVGTETKSGSVYGGGQNADVGSTNASISVSVSGTVNGSVFGGGENGDVTATSLSIDIDRARVNGAVYGGGYNGDVVLSSGYVTITVSGAGSGISTGSVYGGGYNGKVAASTLSVDIDQASIIHSVYGGGLKGAVDASSVSLCFTGASVGDSVYGGGQNGIVEASQIDVDIDGGSYGAVFGGGEGAEATVTAVRIAVTIEGLAIVGTTDSQNAVFGGGEYAKSIVSDEAYIILGKGVTVNGDVHGGGMGSDPSVSIMDADRTVVVNGAYVNGNVYGGSRSGQDDHIVDDGSHVYHDSVILLVAGTVTQSVYGGGFEGVSYLNSSIYVGTSALQQAKDLLGLDLAAYGSRSLWIGNVYGGGNLSSSDTPYGEGSTLLMGNSVIDLAYDPSVFGVSDVQNLRIDGDLFGEGNYSTIGGTSVIYIHEYTMPSNRSMSSIQRCDELYIVNSTLRLTGSADGGVEGLTERYSIVRADMLQLDHSVLHLMAETSNILEYKSRVNGEIATKEDCVRKDGGLAGNEIVLHEGRPFTLVVTGANNVPTAIGTVSGYTLLSKPSGDEYYGVYAMGWEDSDVESGFMVNDGAEEASVMDTPLSGGSSMILRTWYLAGHLTLGQQLVFDGYPSDLTELGGESISIPIQVPRFHGSHNSVFTYIGGFVDPTVQDGLYVVSESDYSNYPGTERRTYLGVSLSGSGVPGGSLEAATYHLTEGGDIWERNLNGEHQLLGSSNILTLTAKLFPMKGNDPGSVGMLGTYTLHLTESTRVKLGSDEQGQPIYGYVPVNMIDIVLTVHVRPVMSNPVNIFVTVMASRDENNRLVGMGYINLPGSSSVLSSGSALTYRVTSAVADDGQELPDVYMWSDTTHLGQSGWTVITYTDSDGNRYHLNEYKEGDYFGEGGIRDTTIAFSYSGDGSGFTLTMMDDSSEARVYNIVVDVEETEPVDLVISYDPLDEKPRQYLSATGDGTQSNPYVFTWTTSKESFKVPYGTVIGTDEGGSGTTLYYRLSQTATVQSGNMWTILRAVLPTEGVELPDYGIFYYGPNLSDLYVDPTFMTRYNPTSELKEDLDLYASFGLKITFHGQGVTVSPQTVFVQPGQELGTFYNNILYKGVGDNRDDREDRITVWDETTVLKGHHLHNFGDDSNPIYSWAVIQDGRFVEYDFDQKVYQELDLYLVWDPNEYHVELTFQDQHGQTMTSSDVGDVTIEVEGETIEASWNGNALAFDTAYGYTMKTTFLSWIVTGLTVNQPDGIESVTIHGLNSGQVSVITPYAGEDGSTIEAVVTLAEGHTLYLEYTEDSGDSIAVGDMLHVDFSQGGNTGSGTFAAGSRSLVFPLIGGGGFTVSLKYEKSGSTVFADYYWTYEVSIDGGRMYEEFQPADGIRGKTVGEYTLASVGSDVHLRIATYRAVHLSSVGEGISSVRVTSYDGDPEVHPSGGSNPVLFAGEVITATAKDGYIMPPADVQGVWAGSVSADSMSQEFTVSGTRDVALGDLTRGSVTISVTLELHGSDGVLDVDDSLLATVYMGTTPYPFQIGFTDGRATVTMTVPYSGTGYSLDADISGFEGPPQNVTISATEIDDGRAECTIQLTLITYHIVYHDTDGDVITPSAGSLTEWDVLNDSNIPECYHGDPPAPSTAVGKTSDGGTLQIWYLGVPSGEQDGTFEASESFCGDLYEGMFTYSIIEGRWETHLFALPSPEGGFSTVQTSTLILVTTVSELNGPHVITGAPFQDERVEFTCASAPGSTFIYTPESSALYVSNAPAGTGLLHLVSGNYSVDIYVFADQDAEVEADIP